MNNILLLLEAFFYGLKSFMIDVWDFYIFLFFLSLFFFILFISFIAWERAGTS